MLRREGGGEGGGGEVLKRGGTVINLPNIRD